MNLLNNWKFWTILYLITAVIFAQSFKKANRKMKNASLLTILLELTTALFALLLIPLFEFKLPNNPMIYITLLGVCIIYAITDRLNIEARYGLEPSTFSMLKQMSSVFIIIFGIILLKEKIVITEIIGASIIIFANLLLTFNKGKLEINKYFIMSLISNLLFAIAMIINVNISYEFNIAFYTILTVFIPAIIIKLFGRYEIKDLKKEFQNYDKKLFILSGFLWCLMLISSVKAYEYGNVVVVAALLALTSLLNTIIEFIINKNRKNFIKKIIVSILIVIGIILIKN